jgi:hypothetical protein
MRLLGVNGRKFSPEALTDALRAKKPLELLVENGDFFRTITVDYKGGLRYPKLVRDEKAPDVLAQILAPKTPHKPRTEKKEK